MRTTKPNESFNPCNSTNGIMGRIVIIFTFAGLFLLPALESFAQGDFLVFPTRLVFEGRQRSQSINLSNTGNDTARYLVSFVQIRMKEDGNFERIEVPDSNQFFADPYLRVFPRRVILGPNEAQVVKIQVKKSDQMLPAEYRSHLYFRAVPDVKPLGEIEPDKKTSSITVELTPLYGISIPVIIRKGDLTSDVSLSNLTFENVYDSIPLITLDFNRIGDMSVYGNVRIKHVTAEGVTSLVGQVDGFGVYTPGEKRNGRILLQKGIDYTSGKLIVTYSAKGRDKGGEFARAELELR